MTKGDRKAKALEERAKVDALALRDEVARLRAQRVVNTTADLLVFDRMNDGDVDKLIQLLYDALSQVQASKTALLTKLRWAADAVAKVQQEVERGDVYSHVPLQNTDDLNSDYARLHQAIAHARSVAYMANVHVPAVTDSYAQRVRAEKLRYTVQQETDGTWRIKDGGDYWTVNGEQAPAYDTEWQAWRAVGTVVR